MLQIDLNIILGSKSPRRVELLKGLDIDFSSRVVETDEVYPSDLSPIDVPSYLALEKANAQEDLLQEDELLITADTIVLVEGIILEKPKSKEEAIQMIRALSGRTHTVITGVCLKTKSDTYTFSDETNVTFIDLLDTEIDYYISKYKPYDKAGSYGVQEWIGYIGIEKMEGSYYNVMGLPVQKLYAELKRFSQ
ncbi:MAG: Maf family nucleotide pyrophosphatase [Crocinitomicaceae bacterium]|nr:Maf family nucleotide pyrophosphatase [Crocinitomicaceae bacterium]